MPVRIGELLRAGLWRHPRTVLAAVTALPLVLLAVDEVTPPDIRFGSLMVAAPTLAAVFCAPAGVLLVILVTIPCVVLSARANQLLDAANFPVQLSTIALISLAAMAASAVRLRRERELARSRSVAAIAQRVLLRPLPRRIGALTFASLYRAADEEAAVGGDLYAAADLRGTTRILLGDAQGKGLAALETAGCVLGAFRRAARHRTPLGDLAAELEEDYREDLREEAAAAEAGEPGARPAGLGEEGFVTAVVLDIPQDDAGLVHMVNLGHPPPLLVHEGRVSPLEPTVPAPPLGLGDLDGPRPRVDTAAFPPGATLLLYTDGLIEARDATGAFYPLTDRLRDLAPLALPPRELLAAVHRDLLRHVGGHLGDDLAMVAIHRAAEPQAARRRAEVPADIPYGRL
ncbi:serine/threonine-protein phosphatase [Streptacidiphilus sp. ASG 303]|uniref:PP2C family protein-serine/threonine phosphatase n=1 Tax=Streptacidiphilus sp. ASG 303 TaxID=2896847 RepID=UPI001E52A0D2|nr:PP2C family protein-serine/threonine phosphatase [Streptacidiphilus sp. ASG 303]MCD0485478.1 serine/threonine-protein phosphatase [Streptacidiphilus sp. ASG 303]